MNRDRSVSTVVLVGSADVVGSVGRPGFLGDHLRPMGDSSPTVEAAYVEGARCDVIAQRLTPMDSKADIDVAGGLEAWFSTMVVPVDLPDTTSLLVMSMAPAVSAVVWCHNSTGLLVQTPDDYTETWTQDQVAWLRANFDVVPPTDDRLATALRTIARELEPSGADLVVFNTSTFVPGEKIYWFRQGEPETTSVRAARVNLVVDQLVKELDLTLVDVDRVTAELGAGTTVTSPVTYSGEALDVLAEEAIARILDLESISHLFASDVMQLTVPRYDRRTTSATLTRWHVVSGAEVGKGDTLFELRFSNLQARLEHDGTETDKVIEMSVVAGRSGFVEEVSVLAGASVDVGTRVGVVTSTQGLEWLDIDNAVRFPVGVKLRARDDD